MSWRSEFLLYLSVLVLFGAVLLWADEATWPVVVLFGVLAGMLLVAMTWLSTRRRTVLVVGGPAEDVERIDRALERAGYQICSCAGPSNRPCPVLLGHACPIAERPLAAVIYRAAGERGRPAPCGRALRVPTVIVEEHMDSQPALAGAFARVGMDGGADRVVRLMEDVLAA